MDWSLRGYRPSDFEVLHKIDHACFPRHIAYSRRELRQYLSFPSADCIVAERENNVGGFILTESERDEGHIVTLDVLAANRRGGLGTALLAEAERHLAERGIRRIVLETLTTNVPGISFWQKHGYRTEGVIPGYYPGPLDAFVMTKNNVDLLNV
ncbi:MAG: GNAT family N-acetyltransferase [Candidatus Acidiferrales bacterium]